MNTRDYFKDIYQDFFGVEADTQEQGRELVSNDVVNVTSQEEMSLLFDRINTLYITDESRDMLKKIIEYMRKYQEGIEKNYIPFRVLLIASNDDVIHNINDILYNASKYFCYIDNYNIKEYSFYEDEKDSIYHNSGFIQLKDVNGLVLEDEIKKKKKIHELEEFLKKDDKVFLTLSGTKQEVDEFFLGREELKNNYFSLEIIGVNPDIQDIYHYVLEHTDISDTLQVELLDYITSTYHLDDDYVKYQKDLVKYISFHKEIPKVKENKSLDEIFNELNELVGLEKVKRVLHELVDVIKFKEKVGDNVKVNGMNLHMVFLGNPGTGKTTIARLISSILYNLGYIKENKLVEVGVKDLVAEYVGQTAPKTMSVIEKSMNGVLFIDEAYALAVKGDNGYNAEAIATLIQAMENYRDKLVVIFAGYTKEMQDFLNSNSGIVSRIGYTFEFEDYTTDELIEIFNGFVSKNGFVVEDEAIAYLRDIINKNRNMRNFGNARFVRNIYEKSIIKHASRVKDKKQKKLLTTITKEDISIENLNLQ